jgi:DNA-binding NtrC family response regulator
MDQRRQILVVARDPHLANKFLSWLGAGRYFLTLVTSFAAAKLHLRADETSLLITEVKLDAYNGLHLALRAQAAHVPTVVIGPSDPVLEKEARDAGATYLPRIPGQRELFDLVEQMLLPRADVDAGGQAVEISWSGARPI